MWFLMNATQTGINICWGLFSIVDSYTFSPQVDIFLQQDGVCRIYSNSIVGSDLFMRFLGNENNVEYYQPLSFRL